MHPGAHVGSGDDAGLKRVIDGLNTAARRCGGFKAQVLLETTAGQGTSLGHRYPSPKPTPTYGASEKPPVAMLKRSPPLVRWLAVMS